MSCSFRRENLVSHLKDNRRFQSKQTDSQIVDDEVKSLDSTYDMDIVGCWVEAPIRHCDIASKLE